MARSPQTSQVATKADLASEPHALEAPAVLEALCVDPDVGLTGGEVLERRARWGTNQLEEPTPRSRWLVYLDQFRNVLVALLLVGAVVAGAVGELKDSIAIAVVLIFNATLGYVQEQKATRSLAALREMLALTTRVKRDGSIVEVETDQLVPGDVVLVEAGDRIPSDGRVIDAWAAEVDESSLTGESLPAAKVSTVSVAPDAPLGDRSNMVFMNTQVTQGRLVFVATATGMATEVGQVASLIAEGYEHGTPLQRQLDGLGKRLAAISGVVVALYFALGILRGDSASETVVSSVALLVAAIPEGLPAVVTLTLAIGTARLARRGAIVKRLASVETLGSTSVICSDKTGTLTRNQMTATAAWLPGRELVAASDIAASPDDHAVELLSLAVLCNDSEVRDGAVIGDPTEGALVALAIAAGVDVDQLRKGAPRLAEVPFDSARKFMVTVHDADTSSKVAAKGAWEVLLERSTACRGGELDEAMRAGLVAAAAQMAGEGLRVLAIASAPAPAGATTMEVDELAEAAVGLELIGLIGLLDPPRTEVAAAIQAAHRAGIDVKMITGDHLDTASAIARQVGIGGEAVSGHDLDELDDDELRSRIGGIGVIARVSPQHKVRIVRALRDRGDVVAMTGDGVNDAAALSAADIGVAMGGAGTEVAKDAADMVLTDDDFTTIEQAVQQGRTIYNNIIKFVRFQLATNIGALASLLGAQIANLPVPFNPIQLLWINIIMDGPPAMALGVDPDVPGDMDRPPRPPTEQILTGRRLRSIATHGLVMAIGVLGLVAWADQRYGTERALSLAFTTFVLMQVANALNVRNEHGTIFSRATLTNPTLYAALAGVVVLQILAVYLPFGASLFGTAPLTAGDWVIAVGLASCLILLEEAAKLIRRRRAGRSPDGREPHGTMAPTGQARRIFRRSPGERSNGAPHP